jgi:5-formyltetrahydrofolate cyclo-ligase
MPSSTSSSADKRNAMRSKLRLARRALSPAYRHEASLLAASLLSGLRGYRLAKRIGLYYPVGSEFDTTALMVLAHRDGKQVFLPVVGRRGARLRFARVRTTTKFRNSRHGIPQPLTQSAHDTVSVRHLDLVLVPLLGFDTAGNRLGSGAGYYDRSFDFKLRRPNGKPQLAGLAYDCQEVKKITAEGWDVRLDAVITESRLICCCGIPT